MFRFFTITLLVGSLITSVSANTNLGVEQSVINAHSKNKGSKSNFSKNKGILQESYHFLI